MKPWLKVVQNIQMLTERLIGIDLLLTVTTLIQAKQNFRDVLTSEGKFTGVCALPDGTFRAAFLPPGEKTDVLLGSFKTREEAARVYDRAPVSVR